MTHAEKILDAVSRIVSLDKQAEFSREQIRGKADVTREEWNASYSPIFQGMREDQPGGAPNVGLKFGKVFRRVRHGVHTRTDYGRQLVKEHEDQ